MNSNKMRSIFLLFGVAFLTICQVAITISVCWLLFMLLFIVKESGFSPFLSYFIFRVILSDSVTIACN